MPNPKDVNPNNYKVKSILYDDNSFSIAIGTWKTQQNILAMRWNGDDKDMGYPKTFGHPMWFIVTDKLKQPIIQMLMQEDSALVDKLLNSI